METLWLWRLYLFIRVLDNTSANRIALAQAFVNGTGGESRANEEKLFDSVIRLSTTGDLPAQVIGFNTAIKPNMKDPLRTILGGLTNARYAVVSNILTRNRKYLELIQTNFSVTPSGQVVTWQTALGYLETEFGLIVIPDTE